jgi:hypothetical protein
LGTLNSINVEAKHQSNLISQIKAGLQSKSTDGDNGAVILQSKTVTPTANDQMVICDNEYDALSSVTVNGDANLKAENIISGANIFGVEGSAEINTNENVGLKWWEEKEEIIGEQKTCHITIMSRNLYCAPVDVLCKSLLQDKFIAYAHHLNYSNDEIIELYDAYPNSLIILISAIAGNYFYTDYDSNIIQIYENAYFEDGYSISIFYISPNTNEATIELHSGFEV